MLLLVGWLVGWLVGCCCCCCFHSPGNECLLKVITYVHESCKGLPNHVSHLCNLVHSFLRVLADFIRIEEFG